MAEITSSPSAASREDSDVGLTLSPEEFDRIATLPPITPRPNLEPLELDLNDIPTSKLPDMELDNLDDLKRDPSQDPAYAPLPPSSLRAASTQPEEQVTEISDKEITYLDVAASPFEDITAKFSVALAQNVDAQNALPELDNRDLGEITPAIANALPASRPKNDLETLAIDVELSDLLEEVPAAAKAKDAPETFPPVAAFDALETAEVSNALTTPQDDSVAASLYAAQLREDIVPAPDSDQKTLVNNEIPLPPEEQIVTQPTGAVPAPEIEEAPITQPSTQIPQRDGVLEAAAEDRLTPPATAFHDHDPFLGQELNVGGNIDSSVRQMEVEAGLTPAAPVFEEIVVKGKLETVEAEEKASRNVVPEYNEPSVTLNPDFFKKEDVVEATDPRAVTEVMAKAETQELAAKDVAEEKQVAEAASSSWLDRAKEWVVGVMMAVASVIGLKSDEPEDFTPRATATMTSSANAETEQEGGIASTDPEMLAKLKANRPEPSASATSRVDFNDETVIQHAEVREDGVEAKPRIPTLENAESVPTLSEEQKLNYRTQALEGVLEDSIQDGTKDRDPNYIAAVRELEAMTSGITNTQQIAEVREGLKDLDSIAGEWKDAPDGKAAAYAQALAEAKLEFAEAGEAPAAKVEGFVEKVESERTQSNDVQRF